MSLGATDSKRKNTIKNNIFTQQPFIQDKSPSLLPYCSPKYVDPFMGYSLVMAKGLV